jgi:hypothetical protein
MPSTGLGPAPPGRAAGSPGVACDLELPDDADLITRVILAAEIARLRRVPGVRPNAQTVRAHTRERVRQHWTRASASD